MTKFINQLLNNLNMVVKRNRKFKKFIQELENIKGRHTELVSVYIPVGYDLNKIIGHLQQEQGTASNIKDARTRKNVIDSLEKIIRHLRLFKKTPKNGLAVFAGNFSSKEGAIDIEVRSIEPPEPLQTRIYRCDQKFALELLKDMMDNKEVYGLIVLDRREGNIGLLKGTTVKEVRKLTSGVPGKFKTGGQSAARFARIREGMAKEFYKRIGDEANKEFLNMKELKGILIGGPGPTKESFFDGNFLNNEVKKKVLGLKDLGYTGEFGLNELVDKSHDLLAEESIIKEKIVVQKFLELLAKNPGKVAYGLKEVKKALEIGAVETLLLSDSLEDDVTEQLEDIAENMGTGIEMISTETKEGNQLKDLGGIAAILRYELS